MGVVFLNLRHKIKLKKLKSGDDFKLRKEWVR